MEMWGFKKKETEVNLSWPEIPWSTRCHSWVEKRRAHAGRLGGARPAANPPAAAGTVAPPQPFPPRGSSQDGGGSAPRGRCPGARPPLAGCMTAAELGEGGGAGGGSRSGAVLGEQRGSGCLLGRGAGVVFGCWGWSGRVEGNFPGGAFPRRGFRRFSAAMLGAGGCLAGKEVCPAGGGGAGAVALPAGRQAVGREGLGEERGDGGGGGGRWRVPGR